jgi:dTMP kinase
VLIVLTGIDGSGKSTAARALVSAVRADGRKAMLLSNHAGRRTMSVLGDRLGFRWPDRLADSVETTLRTINVLASHARAGLFDGLVVMDRHLYCQLALRAAKGLPRGRLLPMLLAALPAPDAVIHLDADPAVAHQRITARGTDNETLAELVSFRDAYRSLPEYAQFTVIDAGVPEAELLAQLKGIADGETLANV